MKFNLLSLAAIAAVVTSLLMAKNQEPTPPNEISDSKKDLAACSLPSHAETTALDSFKKSDGEWKKLLTGEQFRVMRQHGTEPPFRNDYWDNKDKGVYLCAACEAPLFASAQKFKSGTGWPSFWDSIALENIGKTIDKSYGMTRVEVHCNRCGGHLGHLFEDGPRPTHLRYCINSASLDFVPKEDLKARELAAYAADAK